jgi:IS1 family transposase
MEFDEMWHFIGKKKESYGSSKRWIVAHGELWPGCSAVVIPGTFRRLYDKVRHLKNCVFYTDSWEAFAEVLPPERHIIGKQHTPIIERDNSNTRHHLGDSPVEPRPFHARSPHGRPDIWHAVTITDQFFTLQQTVYIKRLGKDVSQKVFLIVDNLRVHHAKKVTAWLTENSEQIELFYLPSYCPELNPDEYLNGDLKARLSAGEPVRSPKAMRSKLFSHLHSLAKQPARIQSYFQHERISYAA